MHPDAIIAIAAAKNSQGADRGRSSATRSAGCRGSGRASSSACGWRNSARENPKAKGVVLESHGLFTWGDTPKDCYETTISHHQPGDRLVRERRPPASRPSAARRSSRCRAAERRAIAARLMPAIRGLISARRAQGRPFRRLSRRCWNSSTRSDLRPLAALGTSCPDHFLRTKIRPLVVDFDPAKPDVDTTLAGLDAAIAAYRADYAAYYERCKHAGLARRCATPMPWSIWCPASA